jgi:hypothetical protein
MPAPRPRPRFELELDDPPERVMQTLRDRLRGCPRCTGSSIGNHAELFVPDTDRHVWSPWLSVTVEDGAAGGSLVRGRFGPHPAVWTLYMFVAFALGFALLVAAAWGYAQWAMEVSPRALYFVPLVLVLAALLYFVSLVGQRLGAEQMETLRSTLEDLVAPDR